MKQSCEIIACPNYMKAVIGLAYIGKHCYSRDVDYDKLTLEKSEKFVRGCIHRNHTSPLEHVHITVMFRLNRAIAQELTRHRIAAYTMTSTRYINYTKGDGEIPVVMPYGSEEWPEEVKGKWDDLMKSVKVFYDTAIDNGVPPENARDGFTLATGCTLFATWNLNEIRHILNLRFLDKTGKAHPQIKQLMGMFKDELKKYFPIIVEDMEGEPTGEKVIVEDGNGTEPSERCTD